VYLEDLCFDAQQAAEKALKGVLIKRGVGFPYVHDLGCLLTLAKESGLELPESILDVARLTDYAVESRYPGVSEAVTTEEYESALRLAEEVVAWAARVVEE
jgi:HEPN domain-containing protein